MRAYIILLGLTACGGEPEGFFAGDCSDGVDNDGNGLQDCADPGCDGDFDCPTFVDDDTDTEPGTDGDTDPDTTVDVDTEPDTEAVNPIPQALAENPPLYDSACDGENGGQDRGAMIWNLGRLTFTGDTIRGYVVWGLRANPAWQAGRGFDCQLTWSAFGQRGTPINCPSCDYSIPVDLTLVTSESTCDPAFVANAPQTRDITYNVSLSGGQAELFIPASGSRIATGTGTDTALDYRGLPFCSFF